MSTMARSSPPTPRRPVIHGITTHGDHGRIYPGRMPGPLLLQSWTDFRFFLLLAPHRPDWIEDMPASGYEVELQGKRCANLNELSERWNELVRKGELNEYDVNVDLYWPEIEAAERIRGEREERRRSSEGIPGGDGFKGGDSSEPQVPADTEPSPPSDFGSCSSYECIGSLLPTAPLSPDADPAEPQHESSKVTAASAAKGKEKAIDASDETANEFIDVDAAKDAAKVANKEGTDQVDRANPSERGTKLSTAPLVAIPALPAKDLDKSTQPAQEAQEKQRAASSRTVDFTWVPGGANLQKPFDSEKEVPFARAAIAIPLPPRQPPSRQKPGNSTSHVPAVPSRGATSYTFRLHNSITDNQHFFSCAGIPSASMIYRWCNSAFGVDNPLPDATASYTIDVYSEHGKTDFQDWLSKEAEVDETPSLTKHIGVVYSVTPLDEQADGGRSKTNGLLRNAQGSGVGTAGPTVSVAPRRPAELAARTDTSRYGVDDLDTDEDPFTPTRASQARPSVDTPTFIAERLREPDNTIASTRLLTIILQEGIRPASSLGLKLLDLASDLRVGGRLAASRELPRLDVQPAASELSQDDLQSALLPLHTCLNDFAGMLNVIAEAVGVELLDADKPEKNTADRRSVTPANAASKTPKLLDLQESKAKVERAMVNLPKSPKSPEEIGSRDTNLSMVLSAADQLTYATESAIKYVPGPPSSAADTSANSSSPVTINRAAQSEVANDAPSTHPYDPFWQGNPGVDGPCSGYQPHAPFVQPHSQMPYAEFAGMLPFPYGSTATDPPLFGYRGNFGHFSPGSNMPPRPPLWVVHPNLGGGRYIWGQRPPMFGGAGGEYPRAGGGRVGPPQRGGHHGGPMGDRRC